MLRISDPSENPGVIYLPRGFRSKVAEGNKAKEHRGENFHQEIRWGKDRIVSPCWSLLQQADYVYPGYRVIFMNTQLILS